MPDQEKSPQNAAGYLAPDVVIKGRIHGEGELESAARVEGPIEVDGSVHISGHVRGLVRARQALVSGVVEGNVIGGEVRIATGGRVIGDVRAARIGLDDGGILDGSVEMDVHLPDVVGDR